jgi:hypothetical protein
MKQHLQQSHHHVQLRSRRTVRMPPGVHTVPSVLHELGLWQYLPLFEAHAINSLHVLRLISNAELVKLLGLPLGVAAQISSSVRRIMGKT